MKFRILDKYLLKELAGPFFFGIAAFSSIFIGTNVLFRIAKYIAQYGAPVLAVVKLFLASLPEIIHYTLPMSMLLASLLAFGKHSASREIVAMRAGGISFARLMLPVIFVALIVTAVAFALGEYVVPASRLAYQSILRNEIEREAKPASEQHVVIKVVSRGELNQLIYARRFDEASGRMEEIVVQDFEKGELARMEMADYAIYVEGRWTLYNGQINELNSDGQISRVITFDKQQLPMLNPPKQLAANQKKPENMSIGELRQQIGVLKKQFEMTSRLKLELYQRYALPFSVLMCALIGSPLGLQPQRSSSSMGFGLSVVIVLIYYVFLSVCTTLGQSGKIPPLLAAWIPNLIGFSVGAFFIRKASR